MYLFRENTVECLQKIDLADLELGDEKLSSYSVTLNSRFRIKENRKKKIENKNIKILKIKRMRRTLLQIRK